MNLKYEKFQSLGCEKTKNMLLMNNMKENRIYTIENIPIKSIPEIIFIGRSNVGKSSLLNAILNHNIAKTSKTPGMTLWLGMHEYMGCRIIDMPGYGYAKVPENRKNLVNNLIDDYLSLKRADLICLLVDLRHGLKPIDLLVLNKIDEYADEVKIIGTKSDAKEAKDFGFDFNVSAAKLDGIKAVRDMIAQYGKPEHHRYANG